MTTYWNIFWRTFAQLALAVALAAQGYDWSNGNAQVSIGVVGFGLVMAAIGGLVAAGYAFAKTPAASAVQKATRSAVQALVGGVAAFAINSVSDIVATEKLLVPLGVAVVLAFAVTYFQNQPSPTPA